MVITSANKKPKFRAFSSAQLHYALAYVLVTTVVLVFLNLYCATENELLFSQSKKAALTERASLVASDIAAGRADESLPYALSDQYGAQPDRVIITRADGSVSYDSAPEDDAVLPALIAEASDAAQTDWSYRDGVMTTAVAVPIRADGKFLGCVYMLEIDSGDGQLLKKLQTNILTITFALESGVVLFSCFYVSRYSRRLKKIMASMRIIQDGDFSHKIEMGGRDELAFLAEEFNYLTDRLQTSENKRRQFVSDASHELKTPLASIKLLADSIVQYDMDEATMREFAGDIGDEADRLTRMTNKLLALTKGEANTAQDEAEIVNFAPTIERVTKMLEGIAEQAHIKIQTNLRQDTTVLVQEDDLYQIAFNLVENAIKYNRPGGRVSISVHRQEDMAVLRISDTGVGIPPEALGHIFERFYRVDKARSRQSGGSGLGLSIVRSMVERNHGEIHLQSTVGKGTTFAVAFPCFDISEEEIQNISREDET